MTCVDGPGETAFRAGKKLKYLFPVLACMLLFSGAAIAQNLVPHMPPNEQIIYDKMVLTDPLRAAAYRTTREYVDKCRQVVADPKRAILLPAQPERFGTSFTTAEDREVVDQAVDLSIAALLAAGGVNLPK
jgi:hypothetical protein